MICLPSTSSTLRDCLSSNYPAHGFSDMAAFWMELILTMGLVSVILRAASGAQNAGVVGAFGVAGVSLWPVCGLAPFRAPP